MAGLPWILKLFDYVAEFKHNETAMLVTNKNEIHDKVKRRIHWITAHH